MSEKEFERIKILREKKGITQQQVADHLGVHYNTIANWESGRVSVRGANRMALANLFGVSVEYLRTGEGEEGLPSMPPAHKVRPAEEAAMAWANSLLEQPLMGKAIAVLMQALRRRGLDMDDARAGKIILAIVQRAQEAGHDPLEEWAIEEILKPSQ